MTTVRSEMTKQVAFALEDDDIDLAFQSMQALGIHHVPVLRDGYLVGMLSDRDILILATRGKYGNVTVPKKKISCAMTKKLVTCRTNDSISHVAELMLTNKVHAIPVVDDENHLVGIISSSDLIRLLQDRTGGIDTELPFQFQQTHLFSETNH